MLPVQIVKIPKHTIEAAAKNGTYAYCNLFAHAALGAVGGSLTAENMQRLNDKQITLIAYIMLREEVLEGGFIQLIHNGYGAFIFDNPFAIAVRFMGLRKFAKLLYNVRGEYKKNRNLLLRDCSDEEFMALYEQYPKYDKYDDEFVEHEPEITDAIAQYIGQNIAYFAVLED